MQTSRTVRFIGIFLLIVVGILGSDFSVWAVNETPFGQIEGRLAPVFRRICLGGINAGDLCNENANCPGSSCADRNVFNLFVSVRFNATPAQLAIIQTRIDAMAASLWDSTDGQVQIGEVFLLNNSFGASGDIWVQAGAGLSANSGHWAIGGKIFAGMSTLTSLAGAGEGLAHEFGHLVFDARDEYESRAAGCGGLTGGAQCPTLPGEERCLMDQGGTGIMSTEFCWSDNHEAALVTEQSRCRSNRSCWDQIGWSWPNTMLVPAGAPDPVPPAGLDPVVFIQPPSNARIVLVLDTSGSMDAESPSRIDRLKTAALDFVALAENGVELGVVSFNDPATDEVAIAALAANRVAYTTAINNLCSGPGNCAGWTNISDGLQNAKDMIDAAGGVTANTFIVLMTDGINNRPTPNFAALLMAKLNMLNGAGVPVYVTCTGGDFGLNSQCAEIAAATGGTYVDSADADNLPEVFSYFHEVIMGSEIVASQNGFSEKGGGYTASVEAGARSASFTLQWRDPGTELSLVVTSPLGTQFFGTPMPLGQFVRVSGPTSGDWTVDIIPGAPTNIPDAYISRAYLASQPVGIPAAPATHMVEPGNALVTHAFPLFDVPLEGCLVEGVVRDPNGTSSPISHLDDGSSGSSGDDVANDGVYTAILPSPVILGAYQYHMKVDCSNAEIVLHNEPTLPAHDTVIAPYVREILFTAVVNDAPLSAGRQICTGNVFGEPGTTVKIPVFLFDGTDVAGFQVEALFNPAVLTPVGVSLGADTAAAGGWIVSNAVVGPGVLRVLGASNPPVALSPGFQEVALVEFQIALGVPLGDSFVGMQNCILSDELGLSIACNLCTEPGAVIVRPASSFKFRPIGAPVGVDEFDPLPFLVTVDALNSFGGVATGYNGTADMVIPNGLCASTLQPNALGFGAGLGVDFFKAACCMDSILPTSTTNLSIDASDPSIFISGSSGPFLGVAKGDLDAGGTVDVLDVIRTTLLSLSLPVAIPPSLSFQQWAGDMLNGACAPDGLNNILDVIRVENKALGFAPLCICDGARGAAFDAAEAVTSASGPVSFRLEKQGKRDFVIQVENANDLAGFQFELRGASRNASLVLEGLTAGGDWQIASNFDKGVLKVLAYSSTVTGVSGDGAVLRVRNAAGLKMRGIIASDSRGREIETK